MQIKNDTNEVRYTATDGQIDFVFDFPVYYSDHLTVYDGEVLENGTLWIKQTLNSDFMMVHTDADKKTGKVVFSTGRTAGHKVLIIRAVPLTQLSEYIDDDRLPAKVFETDINLGVMIDQQHAKTLKRCFKLPETSEIEDLVVPEPEAGRVLYWLSSTEMGNKDVAELGAVILPLEVAQGGTGKTSVAAALTAFGLSSVLKADTPDILQTVFGDEAQIHTGTDLSNLTVTRNHIEWTLSATSTFSDATLPYDGAYVFHVYPATNTLSIATSYKTNGALGDPDSAAGEVRIVVEQFNSRKTIVSLQNMEV
ncbi:MAG: hypothetical protein JEY79_00990 [Pseudodesulfovibrio sp.]|nr:hypothetical protein [Pseudodesulfovibrio sp.]